jgi:hypothetical protein
MRIYSTLGDGLGATSGLASPDALASANPVAPLLRGKHMAETSRDPDGGGHERWYQTPLGITAIIGAAATIIAAAIGVLGDRLGDPPSSPVQTTLLGPPPTSTTAIETTVSSQNVGQEATTTSEGALGVDSSDAKFSKELRLPYGDRYVAVILSEGLVETRGNADLYYGGDRGRALERAFATWSTDVPSGPIGRDECRESVETRPRGEDVLRTFRKGDRICLKEAFEGGVALLEVVQPPDRKGTLILQETYWEG